MATNKELKEQYKQLKFKMGVYQLRNTVNGKILIGSSVNLDAIWNRLKMQLNFRAHQNALLQADWDNAGEGKFVFEILSEIKQKKGEQVDYAREVKQLEALYIEELSPFNERGYNG